MSPAKTARCRTREPQAPRWCPVARLAIRNGWFPAALAAVAALSAALAGCATAPSGGPPRAAPGGSNQVKAYVQPLPPPAPDNSWLPEQVVLGFLHASASYAFDPSAARQYLVPELRKDWHPGQGPVAVVSTPTNPPVTQIFNPHDVGSGGPLKRVEFTAQHLATLSQSGQYQYAPESVQY